MGSYQVESIHLNIDEGDSAIHLLQKNNKVQSVVFIDGGRTNAATEVQAFMDGDALAPSYRREDGSLITNFDAVVVTHWDDDHAMGFYNLFATDLAKRAQKYVEDNKEIKTDKVFQEHANGWKIRSNLCRYSIMPETPPLTYFHSPYWEFSKGMKGVGKVPVKGLDKVEKDSRCYVTFEVLVKIKTGGKSTKSLKAKIPALRMGLQGEHLIGYDIFSQNFILAAKDAKDPARISEAMSKLEAYTAGRPAMVCIACNGVFCDNDNFDTRDAMEWKDDNGKEDLEEMNISQLKLVKGTANVATSRGTLNDQVSITAIQGDTTTNNLSSVISMIFWPNPIRAKVTHYIAGDAGDWNEHAILKWATVPTADANIRKPIEVEGIKLSHHGAKFSTPLLMLFAWRPAFVICSNGLRKKYNHLAWEIFILVYVYMLWRRKLALHNAGIIPLHCTNYPIYLCRYWAQETNSKISVSPGGVKALTGPIGAKFRKLLAGLRANAGVEIADLPSGESEETRQKVVGYICERWNATSPIKANFYARLITMQAGVVLSKMQQVRVIWFSQNREEVRIVALRGPDMNYLWLPAKEDEDEVKDPDFVGSLDASGELIVRSDGRAVQSAVIVKPAINPHTRGDSISLNRSRRPIGPLCSKRMVELLSEADVANDYHSSSPDKRQFCPLESHTWMNIFDVRHDTIATLQKSYIVAYDASVGSNIDGSIHRAEKERNLDLFLGDLQTGAIVFSAPISSAPTQAASSIMLDASDDISQWFMDCMGNYDDQTCRVSASTTVTEFVNISNFELKTKLKYALSDPAGPPDTASFFQSTGTFNALSNGHAFDLPKDTTKWPNVPPTGDVDIVGKAHVACLSLAADAIIEEATISGIQILDLIGLKASGPVSWLATLTSFSLDTSPGSRNTIWFSPGVQYDTTLRLTFRVTENGSQLQFFARIKELIREIPGITDAVTVNEARLIAKKKWTRSSGQNMSTSSSLTAQTKVTLSVANQDPLILETALTLSPHSYDWILNFDPEGGGQEVDKLLQFVAKVFSTGEIPRMTSSIPGASNLLLRQIRFISWRSAKSTNEKALELTFQLSFTGLAFLCTVRGTYANGKLNFGLFGGLFPENRSKKLGDDFTWVEYMPEYEPWVAIQLTPVKNAAGQLDDVEGSDTADLSKVYKELAKKDLPEAPIQLELLGLEFALTSKDIAFKAIIVGRKPDPKTYSVPFLRLQSASLDLKCALGESPEVTTFELATSIVMSGPDETIEPAFWNLMLQYSGDAWTLAGGLSGLRGSLLYSLFDSDCNLEMSQLLSSVILDLQLEYTYGETGEGASLTAAGILHLGNLDFSVIYKHHGAGDWSFTAGLGIGSQQSSLGDVLACICGQRSVAFLPECVRNIIIEPRADLTKLSIDKSIENCLIFMINFRVGDSFVAFYQIQRKRANKDDKTAPAVKRCLVFSIGALPTIKDIPLVGDLPQPFDELRFMWMSSSDEKASGWTAKDISDVNGVLAAGFPHITFKDTKKAAKKEDNEYVLDDSKQDDRVILQNGLHFCLLQGGATKLDYLISGQSKHHKKTDVSGDKDGESANSVVTTPIDKTFGPIRILGVGLSFSLDTEILTLVLDGSLQLGPIELTLLGFSITFGLKDFSLLNLSRLRPTPDLSGLGLAFQKDPLTIAGLFEHQVTATSDMYLGGAIVGFKPWTFEAGGYYGTSEEATTTLTTVDRFTSFLAYVRVSGPVATIGYAEIRGLVGGFGYNTSIRFPNMESIADFPFLQTDSPKEPSKALANMLKGGWFSNKKGQNWVAAGLTVLAFEMLTATAVVVVEWGSGVKLGIFGLATAEMPKQLDEKFAKVQLGLTATVDFDAGILRIDGQLTPASFILDPSCHLAGGFALYSWFGEANKRQQGDWVFTIGGYHGSYQKPSLYPKPPRLGVSWSFDSNINISGQSYFAITPKCCMGGGSLHVTISLGPLQAYLDAYADFLINYRPFTYQAQGGVSVGVHYTMDLWLVTVPIDVDIGATLLLRGPPLAGKVHVDFYVVAFDVNFGTQTAHTNNAIDLDSFFNLVLQTASKATTLTEQGDIDVESTADDSSPPAHIFNCTSGLIPQEQHNKSSSSQQNLLSAFLKSAPHSEMWTVRGAVFAFTVSCKFAINQARIFTEEEGSKPQIHKVDSKATGQIYSKPMQLDSPLGQSTLEVHIKRITSSRDMRISTSDFGDPVWDNASIGYSNLPTALWSQYDHEKDPANPSSDNSFLLNGNADATTQLMTNVTLSTPPPKRSPDCIVAFDIQAAMGQRAGCNNWPQQSNAQEAWKADPAVKQPKERYQKVKQSWAESGSALKEVGNFMAHLGYGQWQWNAAKEGKLKVPERFRKELDAWMVEAPAICIA